MRYYNKEKWAYINRRHLTRNGHKCALSDSTRQIDFDLLGFIMHASYLI